jgi:hypothetical protein
MQLGGVLSGAPYSEGKVGIDFIGDILRKHHFGSACGSCCAYKQARLFTNPMSKAFAARGLVCMYLFAQLEDQRTYLYEQLLQALQPTLRHKLNLLKPPVIGMHIRRGDFKRGSTITPNAYFINGINLCRQIAGKQLPVTVFSDAAASEIQDILDLPFVTLSPPKEDVLDILLLSKSDILFLSATSTFSYWAGFFSNSIVIRPNSDWLPNIKKKAPLPYQEIIWDGSSQFSFQLNFQNTVNEG